MRIGIYPGSFDPLTYGHIDIVERSRIICDKLIIAIAKNYTKEPLFSFEERERIIRTFFKDVSDNIEVVSFDGLVVDYCRERGVSLIIRGLRSGSDFDYENTVACVNRKLAPEIETVFLISKEQNAFISSNIVRELASYNGDITSLVPQFVLEEIQQKLSESK
ncbi:pantetheine-phosphate adenylyltransferase [Spirochaetota bacterium]